MVLLGFCKIFGNHIFFSRRSYRNWIREIALWWLFNFQGILCIGCSWFLGVQNVTDLFVVIVKLRGSLIISVRRCFSWLIWLLLMILLLILLLLFLLFVWKGKSCGILVSVSKKWSNIFGYFVGVIIILRWLFPIRRSFFFRSFRRTFVDLSWSFRGAFVTLSWSFRGAFTITQYSVTRFSLLSCSTCFIRHNIFRHSHKSCQFITKLLPAIFGGIFLAFQLWRYLVVERWCFYSSAEVIFGLRSTFYFLIFNATCIA